MLTSGKTNGKTGKAAILMALILVAGVMCAAAQSAPPIVVSSTATVVTSGTSNVDKVVQDTCGNLYELENGGNLLEIPAGGGAAIYLASYGGQSADGLSGGIAIDSSNNLYVDSKWNGAVEEIPSTGCIPKPSAAFSVASSSLGAVGNYWYDPGDIYVDGAGDIFVASNNCCNGNGIFEQTAAGKGVQVLGGNSLPQVESLAADSSGDVFFTVSGSGAVYEVPLASYGTSSPKAVISSGLQTALGLAFDSSGNLYVGDTGTGSIYEVPFTTSGSSTTPALQFASMYLLATGVPIGAPLTISHDNKSFFFGDNTASVYQQALGSANIGAVALGSSGTATVDVAFNAAVTPSAFTLYPSGGQFSITNGSSPCSAGTAYTAGQSCNAIITFSPATLGTAVAGAVFAGTGGVPLTTLYVSGIGEGPGLTLDPGTVAATGSGLKSPESVAIDSVGDVFYADAGNNAVLEFTSGSSAAVSIGAGLSKPAGVAVDGAGDVFIADTGNNRIVEVPIVSSVLSNAAQIALPTTLAGTALKAPAGVAVDSAGDLFIADTGNNRIVGIPYNGTLNTSAAVAIGSSLSGPLAVVANASGNLYVADSGAGQIYEIFSPLAQSSQQLVAVGFGNPTGLAVDASGSLFVADYADGEIVRIPNVSGSLEPNDEVQAGIGVSTPYGVALDPYGNLYASSGSGGSAYLITRTSTTLAFGDWALSTSSGVLAATVEDEGNQSLILGSPYYAASGNTGDFSISATASDSCASGAMVAPGESCELDATFAPLASGTRTDTLTLSSNAANASSAVTLTGDGTTIASTNTKLAMTSPASGSPSFGQAITLSVTVTAASGTPTGTVTLVVDGAQVGDATLSSSGAATFDLASGLTGGSHTLVAIYNGTSSFNGSVSSALQISVVKAPTVTTLTVTPSYTNPYSAVQGNAVTFTAVISFAGIGIPTGTVTFTSGGTTLGTAPVLPASGGVFEATFSTTSLAVGNYNVVATYPGDPNYIGSASAASSTIYIVSSPQVTVTTSGTSITSSTSSNGTVTFTATTYGGWTGLVGFNCVSSSLPVNARCVFSPGQITLVPSTPTTTSSNPTVSLAVTIDQPPQTPTASKFVWWLAGPAGLLLFFARRRFMRRGWATISMVIALALLGITASGLTACTSGTKYVTPTGSSTVTVVVSSDPFTSSSSTTTQSCPANNPASAPCAQQSFQVSLTVQ